MHTHAKKKPPMTNDKIIQDLIDAGERATQGNFKYMGKDCSCDNCFNCEFEIYTENYNKLSAEIREDARFIVAAANAREAIKAQHEELLKLREEIKALKQTED